MCRLMSFLEWKLFQKLLQPLLMLIQMMLKHQWMCRLMSFLKLLMIPQMLWKELCKPVLKFFQPLKMMMQKL